ncbi:hypothetical protein K7X08_010064 [Anisodus acutangulus]|uniref:Uncharacterized protein n=1 Tax=Anisodus acutangulus TaxID=402998 RepID=A0A9Q1N452_9SOLA|nr:hypothetical protein K7X08_010064 [Anisodus acutangulus]
MENEKIDFEGKEKENEKSKERKQVEENKEREVKRKDLKDDDKGIGASENKEEINHEIQEDGGEIGTEKENKEKDDDFTKVSDRYKAKKKPPLKKNLVQIQQWKVFQGEGTKVGDKEVGNNEKIHKDQGDINDKKEEKDKVSNFEEYGDEVDTGIKNLMKNMVISNGKKKEKDKVSNSEGNGDEVATRKEDAQQSSTSLSSMLKNNEGIQLYVNLNCENSKPFAKIEGYSEDEMAESLVEAFAPASRNMINEEDDCDDQVTTGLLKEVVDNQGLYLQSKEEETKKENKTKALEAKLLFLTKARAKQRFPTNLPNDQCYFLKH